jgi:hypothetical protein
VTSQDLTPEQAKTLADALTRQGAYLSQLVARMRSRHWPEDDVLYAQTLRAREAIVAAIETARHIEQENAKPEWARRMGG